MAVRKLSEPGRYADGGNLYLYIGGHGAKAWIFRYQSPVTSKLRDMGLGPVADVTLEHARKRAADARMLLLEGADPIDRARELRDALRIERANKITFTQCAEKYIAAHRASWRNAKHADQWASTLATYCTPINGLPVDKIDTGLVLRCLESEWATKHETMTRVRQRVEAVLDWATARKYRQGDNPARWRGHLDKLLPVIAKKKRVVHRPALPYGDMAVFMAELRQRQGLAARVLELQILTATRPGEAAGALWSEIDLDAATWTIPASRMKASAEHRIPLSGDAVALLRSLPRMGGHVFPGMRGKAITTAAGMQMLKDIRPGITAHGFRSTFRDWAGDRTAFAHDVVEAALAHTIKNAAEAAYRRGDALAKRHKLMQAWADYCATPAAPATVTPIKRRKA